MKLVPAVCTQCNARIEVDPSQQAAVCAHCGTAFVVEQAITHYHVIQTNTYNIETNVHAKRGVVESVLGYVQQKKDAERRKIEEAQRQEEERKERKRQRRRAMFRHIFRHWQIYLTILVVLVAVGSIKSYIAEESAKPKDVTRKIAVVGMDKASAPLAVTGVRVVREKRLSNIAYTFVAELTKTSEAPECFYTFNVTLADKNGKYIATEHLSTMPRTFGGTGLKLLSRGDTLHIEEEFYMWRDETPAALIFSEVVEHTKEEFIALTLEDIRSNIDEKRYDYAKRGAELLLKLIPNHEEAQLLLASIAAIQEQQSAEERAAAEAEAARIAMPEASSDFYSENYQDVITQLQLAGFTNIETTAMEDLIFGFLISDGGVETVSVNGRADYQSGDKFEAGALILITYHTFASTESAATSGTSSAATAVETTASASTAPEVRRESIYDLAYMLRGREYSLYMLFDTDEGVILSYSSAEHYIEEYTYKGDLSSGADIDMGPDYEGAKSTARYKGGNDSRLTVVYEGDATEWEKIDVTEAEAVLEKIEMQRGS